MEDKKTPLYDMHVREKGKMVSFADYLLPVQYETGIITEHMSVRQKAGLFDVSHMGEIVCIGGNALNNLNRILTNDIGDMADGQARYSLMCNEHGGIIDDLVIFRIDKDHYMINVNAANREKDFAWMKAHQTEDTAFTDMSGAISQIALQGPEACEILKLLAVPDDIPEKYYHFKFNAAVAEIKCMISKTGYTGENGYEFYLKNEDAPEMWGRLLRAGKERGLIPCGLGARDTLRLEAAMPLYGHELNDEISPFEAGLGFAVKMAKDDFIGKTTLENRGEPFMRRVGLEVVGRGIVRENEDLFIGGNKVGYTTSGTYCPYLGHAAAMAYVGREFLKIGTRMEASVRGRRVETEVVPLPFYRKQAQHN